jgi:RNA polymerase subunit RPABC4/transcription elongation factor Spt4
VICPNCSKEINKNIEICPFCNDKIMQDVEQNWKAMIEQVITGYEEKEQRGLVHWLQKDAVD